VGFVACMGGWQVGEVCGEGSVSSMGGEGLRSREAGDNLLQYCHVGYVFRIIWNIGLFVSVKLPFI
jgi:hypothetical protein